MLAYPADTTRRAGTFWLTDAWPPVTEFGGVDQPWAQTIVWGTRIVRGSSIVEVNQAAWAANIVWGTGQMSNVVWGTGMAWDDNIVWGTGLLGTFDGDNIVWGTSSDGADNIVWGTLSDDNIVWGTSENTLTIPWTSNRGAR